jgi:hypothetical protein
MLLATDIQMLRTNLHIQWRAMDKKRMSQDIFPYRITDFSIRLLIGRKIWYRYHTRQRPWEETCSV